MPINTLTPSRVTGELLLPTAYFGPQVLQGGGPVTIAAASTFTTGAPLDLRGYNAMVVGYVVNQSSAGSHTLELAYCDPDTFAELPNSPNPFVLNGPIAGTGVNVVQKVDYRAGSASNVQPFALMLFRWRATGSQATLSNARVFLMVV